MSQRRGLGPGAFETPRPGSEYEPYVPAAVQLQEFTFKAIGLGSLFMVPLRRFLIEREHGKLPYPEGNARAEVLVANEMGGGDARFVFIGLAGGAAFKALTAWARAIPDAAHLGLPAMLDSVRIGLEQLRSQRGAHPVAVPRSGQELPLKTAGIGLLTSAVFVCLAVLLLAETFGFSSTERPAPQAMLMKRVIDGVLDPSLPWGLVAFLAFAARFSLQVNRRAR